MSVRLLCDKFWAWRMREYPELATAVGLHDNDHLWDDVSELAIQKRKVFCENFLVELKAATTSSSDKGEKQFGNLLIDEIETFLSGIRHKSYLFAVNVMEGPHIDHCRVVSWMKFNNLADYEKAMSRLRSLPESLQQIQQLLQIGVDEGRVPSVVSTKGILKQFADLVSCPAEESGFYKSFLSCPSSITNEDQQRLQTSARQVIQDLVYPAFKQLADFIEKVYIPACRTDPIGCIALPDGKQLYQDLLAFHTTTSLSSQEVHDIGVQEVKRIRASMEQVMEEVSFSGSLQDFIQHLRSDSRFHHTSREVLVQTYKDACSKIHGLLPQIFRTVRDVPCDLVETPAQFAPTAPAAYYLAPSEDGSRPGTFYINTYDFESRPTFELMALCLHECEPGHHFQSVFAMQQEKMPGFRRHVEDRLYYQAPGRFALHTAYMEGWGLYCESLGHELGLYDDPYMRFGRYSLEILRACRLVVDTGMHVLGWSRQQAIDYLCENTALSQHNVITEIDRYITWPGQACAYKIGELEIQKLRKEVQTKLGEKFDVRDFHEALLSCGPVPVKFFKAAIREQLCVQ